jgi:hypothetical protein
VKSPDVTTELAPTLDLAVDTGVENDAAADTLEGVIFSEDIFSEDIFSKDIFPEEMGFENI